MHHIDYGLGVLTARALVPMPGRARRSISPPSTSSCVADGELAGFEVSRALLRDRIARRARGDPRRPSSQRGRRDVT